VDQIKSFNQEAFNQQTLRVIAALRLSFRSLENIELQRLIRMASLAHSPPELLKPGAVRERLQQQVNTGRDETITLLPPTAKISLVINC
jgi:hypothetical protein